MYKLLPTIALIIALTALFLNWSNKHDKDIAQAAALYEACVMEEYDTTPARWYQEHGEYPYCPFNK